MLSVKVMALAGAAALLTTAANAADMPQMMPPPMYVPQCHGGGGGFGNDCFAGGWYLRGDIGMSNQKVGSLFNSLYDSVDRVDSIHREFDSAPFFGLGIGYQFNHWLRVDLTGEYRGGASFQGLDIVSVAGNTYPDEYRGIKSEWLFLANVYADLGTWGGFTPFVGVGVGGSRNTISGFTDTCIPCASVAYGATASKFNFAWAVHAGLSYKVTSNVAVEFAYRYVSLGDALSGDLTTYLGGNFVNNPMHFRNITSHDFKVGVRWMFDTGPAYYSKPAYDFAPPPQPRYDYPPPPLMRRG